MVNEPRRDIRASARLSEGENLPQAEGVGDPFQILRIIWQRLWIILLTIIVCVAAGIGASLQQVPLYEASIKILVGQDRSIAQDPSQAAALADLTPTLSAVVPTRPVAERVVENLDLATPPEAIIGGMSAEPLPETQIIEVTYTDTDPQRAQRIVNAIGDAFSEQVSEMSPNVNAAVSAFVWERAALPQFPVGPDHRRNGLIAFAIGVMLGVGLALLLEYLDDSWQSPEEAEQVSGLPTLAVIPEFERSGRGKVA